MDCLLSDCQEIEQEVRRRKKNEGKTRGEKGGVKNPVIKRVGDANSHEMSLVTAQDV